MIAKERIAGTVTPAICRGRFGLCYCIEKGDVRWHEAEVLRKRCVTIRDNRDLRGDDADSATMRM